CLSDWSSDVCSSDLSLYVCDEVVPDPASRKMDLLGVFGAIQVPDGSAFPYDLGQMCVFAQLEDGEGDATIQVEVVSADAGQVVFYSPVHPVRLPNRLAVVSVLVRIING